MDVFWMSHFCSWLLVRSKNVYYSTVYTVVSDKIFISIIIIIIFCILHATSIQLTGINEFKLACILFTDLRISEGVQGSFTEM